MAAGRRTNKPLFEPVLTQFIDTYLPHSASIDEREQPW